LKVVVAAVWAVSVQLPTPTNDTVNPSPPTVQTLVVLEETDSVPSLFVEMAARKFVP
jgi:hypothetical protein